MLRPAFHVLLLGFWGKDRERAEWRDGLKLRRRDGEGRLERSVALWGRDRAADSQGLACRQERDRIRQAASRWLGRLFGFRHGQERGKGEVDSLGHEYVNLGGTGRHVSFVSQRESEIGYGLLPADVGEIEEPFIDGSVSEVKCESRFLGSFRLF